MNTTDPNDPTEAIKRALRYIDGTNEQIESLSTVFPGIDVSQEIEGITALLNQMRLKASLSIQEPAESNYPY